MHDDDHRHHITAGMPDEGGGVSPVEEQIDIEVIDDDDEPDTLEDLIDEEAAEGEEAVEHEVQLEEVDRLRREHEQLHEMYLRKLAEFDNYRKRTMREREELQKTAAEGVIRELLPVMDNFERALQHTGDGDPQAIRDGVEMIARQLLDLLQREGVEVLDPLGKQFEPEVHEAVQRVEDSETPPGTVVAVHAKGYIFSGRLLRPAMVAVAVEPARAAPQGSGPQADEGGTRL